MKQRHVPLLAALCLALALGSVLVDRPLAVVEDQISALKYALRGPRAPDSSLVLITIDDEAVRTLGWPVRRNFYALMVKALADLRVRAVGIEILFEDPKLDFPEYDELLAAVAASSRNVVLASYAGSARATADGTVDGNRSYPNVASAEFTGSEVHVPFESLRASASGVGHVNFTGNLRIPAFLRTDSALLPAFGLEVLRTWARAGREGVRYDGSELTIVGTAGSLKITPSPGGVLDLDYPGTSRVFPSYPFLEVLRSYDALRVDGAGRVPVAAFRDKIILIGVVAEGRSQFYRTPLESHAPSLAIHATLVDNALRGGFLRPAGGLAVGLVTLLTGLVAGFALVRFRPPVGWVLAGAGLLTAGILSGLLFSFARVDLPVVPPLVAALVAGGLGIALRQRDARHQVALLRAERDGILTQLHDREMKLAAVERELITAQNTRTADRTEELMEEIRRYKAEIRSLASKADDMEVYRAGEGEGGEAAEFEGILHHRAGRMRQVVEFILKIAPSDAPVLVLGESGTGKELVARAIHARSRRSANPFVAVNCGALTETLLESELFGHEKGSFTGAVKDRLGRFELAHGGTIFLDEIGEVSENFQVKLLRVLQEGELERVGGSKTLRVDVRVIAATNRDLREQVRAGKFREDLYYRLNVLTVSLPPLRERREDVPLLIQHFLKREGDALSISRNAMEALQQHEWRGNVRELESVLKRGVLLARAERRRMLALKDLNEEVASTARRLVAIEEQILESLREKRFSRSSVTETADELGGLNRGTVAEYLRGECLKAFVECGYDLDKTARLVALSAEPATLERVTKRLTEYLENLVESLDLTQPWELSRQSLRPKTKNLPQRYHPSLEAVAEAYFRKVWTLKPPPSS
jgi:transcriptional regulator with GAF, ATPase, and Fis domain